MIGQNPYPQVAFKDIMEAGSWQSIYTKFFLGLNEQSQIQKKPQNIDYIDYIIALPHNDGGVYFIIVKFENINYFLQHTTDLS